MLKINCFANNDNENDNDNDNENDNYDKKYLISRLL